MGATGDPDAAQLITADIANFWRAFDASAPELRPEFFEREYLGRGSPGLQEFVRLRVGDARQLSDAIRSRRRYYAGIREGTLRIDGLRRRIRASFYALKYLYADAVFPDVYFLVGRMTAGGCATAEHLLIGTEFFTRGANTPLDELTAWERPVVRPVEELPAIVAHELIHFQQRHDDGRKRSLLDWAIVEGAADFLGEMISGGHINPHLHEYGSKRERALWEAFAREMDADSIDNWLYDAERARDRPADLGYYVGYRIVEAYYGRAVDKQSATREILEIQDFRAFLTASGYGVPQN